MPENEKRGSTGLALKAGFWYVLSTLLVKGLAFITTPIFARLMTKDAYGEFSNFASWISTLAIVTSMEFYNTLNRAYYDHRDRYDRYVSTVTLMGMGITAAIYGVCLIFRDSFMAFLAIPGQYIHILFVTLLFQGFREIFLTREKTLYRYKSVARLSVVNLVVSTLVSFVLVVLATESRRLDARIYGFYIPSALISVYCAVSIFRKSRTLDLSVCGYAFRLALPLMVHYLTAYLLTSSNTLVAKGVLGAEAAAVVSITTSAVHILTILLQAVSGAVTTWLMDNLEQHNYGKLRKSLLVYVAGVSVLAMGVILLGPEVIWILGGKAYAQSVILLPGMVAAVTIQSITTVFTIILTYKKRVAGAAACTAVVAGISVLAKVWLLSSRGIEILPWINIAAFGLLFLLDYLLVCRNGYGNVIHMKGFCGCVLVLCLLTVACEYLYAHMLLRWGIILVAGVAVLAVAYKKRDLILPLIRKKFKK